MPFFRYNFDLRDVTGLTVFTVQFDIITSLELDVFETAKCFL